MASIITIKKKKKTINLLLIQHYNDRTDPNFEDFTVLNSAIVKQLPQSDSGGDRN